MFCSKCGVKNNDDAIFCEECGAPLGANTRRRSDSMSEQNQKNEQLQQHKKYSTITLNDDDEFDFINNQTDALSDEILDKKKKSGLVRLKRLVQEY